MFKKQTIKINNTGTLKVQIIWSKYKIILRKTRNTNKQNTVI